MKLQTTSFILFLSLQASLYSQTVDVTSSADSGAGSLRQAITNINASSDGSNTINMQVPGNSPITVSSDLPVIKKNTEIVSTTQQPIDGQGQYRLFATIMADLSLTNCVLQNGAAIGGDGGGGGMGAGGGVYIDRGNTLTLISTDITSCKAQGGKGIGSTNNLLGGGGASFSSSNKHQKNGIGGGDYPSPSNGASGSSDGSSFLTGYGGGKGGQYAKDTTPSGEGGGDGSGSPPLNGIGGNGGYCGGGGAGREGAGNFSPKGGGGNGGTRGGGGFGSGGFYAGGGGGFGGVAGREMLEEDLEEEEEGVIHLLFPMRREVTLQETVLQQLEEEQG